MVVFNDSFHLWRFKNGRVRMFWSAEKTTAVSSAVFYGFISLTISFLNKAIVSEYHFNYPLFILACQMLVTLCVMELLLFTGKFNMSPVTWSSAKVFALPSFCYSLHATLALVALEGMNIPMYNALKRCTPLGNLILAVTFLKKPCPSRILIFSIICITVGCLIAGSSDPTFDAFTYLMGSISVLLQALYQTLVQKCGENNLTPLHTLHLHSYISLIPFWILSYMSGEITNILSDKNIIDVSFVLLFILLLVMGLTLNFSLFLCTMQNSALTTSVVGVLKAFFATVIGFFVFGGIPFDPVNIMGLIINTIGGFIYTYGKYVEEKSRQRKIDIGDSGGLQHAGWELKAKLQTTR